MLRLLIDQDLDQVILRGLLLRVPNLDVITAHQVGLSDAFDLDLLAWAAEQRVKQLLSNSRVTTKSQPGANRAQSTNSVKRATRKNLNKNGKTAQMRGLSKVVLVPKGGRESLLPFSPFTQQF